MATRTAPILRLRRINPLRRYLRIFTCFARNGLVRELSFRTNFIITALSEMLWLMMMLVFVRVVFNFTKNVEGWNGYQYVFLLGTHFLITSLFETFFFTNIQRLGEMIRTGSLDFVLLKPASPQFLLSLERIDYAALANAPLGAFLCIYCAIKLHLDIGIAQVGLFVLLVSSGVLTLYGLMFMFATTSIWFIRQTGASHFWFYLTSCAKYPAEIYKPLVRGVLYFVLTFVFPVLIVANLPARVMVRRAFSPWMVVYAAVIATAIVLLSLGFFRWALRWYRSASS